MANLLSVAEVAAIRGMDESQRGLFFNVIATARRVSLADVERSYTELLSKADEHDKREAAKVEAAKRASLLATLSADVEAFRLGTTADNGDEHDISLLEELRERAEGFGAAIVFAGIGEDSAPRFVVRTVKAATPASSPQAASTGVRGGGTGAGRPANDAPQPYVDADTGARVVGPVTMWLRKNVNEERLNAAGLLKADGKLKASGSVMASLAVKAGILNESPLEDETPVEASSTDGDATPAS